VRDWERGEGSAVASGGWWWDKGEECERRELRVRFIVGVSNGRFGLMGSMDDDGSTLQEGISANT